MRKRQAPQCADDRRLSFSLAPRAGPTGHAARACARGPRAVEGRRPAAAAWLPQPPPVGRAAGPPRQKPDTASLVGSRWRSRVVEHSVLSHHYHKVRSQPLPLPRCALHRRFSSDSRSTVHHPASAAPPWPRLLASSMSHQRSASAHCAVTAESLRPCTVSVPQAGLTRASPGCSALYWLTGVQVRTPRGGLAAAPAPLSFPALRKCCPSLPSALLGTCCAAWHAAFCAVVAATVH